MAESELDQIAKTLGVERNGCGIGGINVLEQDHINPTGDGIEPVSNYGGDDVSLDAVIVKSGTALLMEFDCCLGAGSIFCFAPPFTCGNCNGSGLANSST